MGSKTINSALPLPKVPIELLRSKSSGQTLYSYLPRTTQTNRRYNYEPRQPESTAQTSPDGYQTLHPVRVLIHHIPSSLNTALIIMGPPPMRLRASGIPEHGIGSGGAVPVTVVAGSALGLAADGVACNMLRIDRLKRKEGVHVIPWAAKL